MSLLLLTVLAIVLITALGALVWHDALAVGAFAVAVMLLLAVVVELWGAAIVSWIGLVALSGYGCVAKKVHP